MSPHLPHWKPLDPVTVPPVGGGVVSYPEAPVNPSTPRRPRPLDRPARDVKTLVDRVTAAPVPAGWRTRRTVSFNSAV